MLVVAIGTYDVIMGASRVLAGGRVLRVEGGEVRPRTLVTVWGPGAAHIGSVAPFEAR